nr:hypothetical protein [Runella sp. CRIBMP]
MPVAAKIALASAAAIGGRAGSPKPVGASSESTNFTSISDGASFYLQKFVEVKISFGNRPIHKGYFWKHGMVDTIYDCPLNLIFSPAEIDYSSTVC